MLKIRENIDIDTVAAICAGSLETLQMCNYADNPRELFGVELYFLTRVCSFCTYLKVLVIDNASIKAEDLVLLCQKLVNRRGASRHFTLHIDPKNIKFNFQGKKSSKKYKEWKKKKSAPLLSELESKISDIFGVPWKPVARLAMI